MLSDPGTLYCYSSLIIFGYFPHYGIAPAGPAGHPGMFHVLHLIIEQPTIHQAGGGGAGGGGTMHTD